MFKSLGGLGNMASLVGKMGELQEKAKEIHQKTGELVVTGAAEGGAVEVDVTGHGVMTACRIAPALLSEGGNDASKLERLVMEAANDAGKKAKAAASDLIKQGAEDAGVPGLAGMLEKFTG